MSVILVNLNRAELLRKALQSVLREARPGVEVIVVDNASTDGSAEMVEREFAGVRLIRNTTNKGFCEANNQGIAIAHGEYIALLNNDAEAEPGWLDALVRALERAPRSGMAASKVKVWEDPRRLDKVGHLIFLDGQNRGRGSGEIDSGQYDTMEDVLWPDGCAALYRHTMLDEIGAFDEDFFAYADDAELGLRARLAGWECVYAPDAVVQHHRGATLGVRSLRRVELIERNRVLLAAKLFPWSLLWLNGVFYLARLAAGLWAGMIGRGEISRFPGWKNKMRVGLAMLRADWEALTMLPRILKKRKAMRRLRRLSTMDTLRLLWKHRISLKELSQQSI
ncbi:MAG: glycosyltransferase family 2 protein [Bryobacterales bacterium]|nr:glycosyltransferase family 2 protein [Bryobacterales bacterium]